MKTGVYKILPYRGSSHVRMACHCRMFSRLYDQALWNNQMVDNVLNLAVQPYHIQNLTVDASSPSYEKKGVLHNTHFPCHFVIKTRRYDFFLRGLREK